MATPSHPPRACVLTQTPARGQERTTGTSNGHGQWAKSTGNGQRAQAMGTVHVPRSTFQGRPA
eukprot:259987-Chlamydomonas_euryale.AAC.1